MVVLFKSLALLLIPGFSLCMRLSVFACSLQSARFSVCSVVPSSPSPRPHPAVRGFEAPRGADSTGSQAARYAADRVGQGLMAQALTPETGLSMLRLASNPTNLVVASASSATGGLAGGQNAPGDPKNQAGSMGGLGCCWCITIALCILEIVMGAKVLGSGDPCGRMGKMMVCAGALAMVCCSACVSNGMQNRGKVQVGVGANSAGAASNALGCLCCLSYLALIGVLIWGATIFYSPATAAQCAGLEGGKPFRTGYWLTTFFFVYLGTMVPLVILLCACCWVAVAAMGMAGFIDAAQRGDINQLRAARTGFSGAGRNQEGPDNTDAPDVQAPDNV